MFPRLADGFGHFTWSGQTTKSKVSAIRSVLVEQQSGKVAESKTLFPDAEGRFLFSHRVPAQLHEYRLLVYELGAYGNDSLIKTVSGLVAGDFYLIAGQSNAEAGASHVSEGPHFDSLYALPFCRAIGSNFVWATGHDSTGRPRLNIAEDCRIARASSVFGASGNRGFAGAWGLRLQHDMALASGIPSCFVNAGKGSASILDCFPTRVPSSPSLLCHSEDSAGGKANVYDRSYKKLVEAGAAQYVRGIFWYQGETDADNSRDSALAYDRKFAALRRAWKLDFPALEKIIVIQVSIGCGGGQLRLIAEQQRRFPTLYNDVATISSVGFGKGDQSDYCHYRLTGYVKLAEKLLPPALEYFYSRPMQPGDLPASLLEAKMISPGHLRLEFDREVALQPDLVYPDSTVWSMKDNFYGDGDRKLTVDSVYADSREMHVLLDTLEKEPRTITYLPANYSKYGLFFGPWIVNGLNSKMGALVFCEVAVRKDTEDKTDAPAQVQGEMDNKGEHQIRFFTSGAHTVVLYDSAGRMFAQWQTTDDDRISIDISGLDPGLYVIRHFSDRESGALKLLKQ